MDTKHKQTHKVKTADVVTADNSYFGGVST